MNKQRWEKMQLPVIALLLASALFLFTQTPLFTWPADSFSLSQLLRSKETEQTDSSALIMPLQMTVTNQYGRHCYDRLTTQEDVYLQYLPLFNDALTTAGAGSRITAEAFQQACLAPGVAIDLLGEFDPALLEQLFRLQGGALPGAPRHLLLTEAADRQTLLLYTAEENGSYTLYNTQADAAALEQSGSGVADGALFAFELSHELYPLSMYPETPGSYPLLSAANPLEGAAAEGLAALLDFSTNSSYTESSGTQVLVDDASYLYLLPEGSVHYQGGENAGERFSFSGSSTSDSLTAAWQLAERLSGYIGGSGQLYLQSCRRSENGYLLQFGYMVQGLTVQLRRDPFALQVRTENGVITDFVFHARHYTVTEEDSLILPVSQAAAAIGEKQHLWLGYADTDGEKVPALWLSR